MNTETWSWTDGSSARPRGTITTMIQNKELIRVVCAISLAIGGAVFAGALVLGFVPIANSSGAHCGNVYSFDESDGQSPVDSDTCSMNRHDRQASFWAGITAGGLLLVGGGLGLLPKLEPREPKAQTEGTVS